MTARQAGHIFTRFRQGEVNINKMTQIEAGLVPLHTIIRKNHERIAIRYGVSKGFLIGEEFCILDIIKERAKQNIRRLRSFSVGRRVCGSRRKRCKRQQRPCQRQFYGFL